MGSSTVGLGSHLPASMHRSMDFRYASSWEYKDVEAAAFLIYNLILKIIKQQSINSNTRDLSFLA